MKRKRLLSRIAVSCAVLTPLIALAWCYADPSPTSRVSVTEPVYRVAKTPAPAEAAASQQAAATTPAAAPAAGPAPAAPMIEAPAALPGHPLDPALKWAYEGLDHLRANVSDYTATVVKRERVGNAMGEAEHMFVKIRNRKVVEGKVVQPFSVYLQFLKPEAVKGREVVWVEGKNNGKMCAHEGGRAGAWLPTVWIPPDGLLAMRGQRYPLTDLGIENMVVKLIEKGERDRKRDECEVQIFQNAKVNGVEATCIQVIHPTPRPHFDFHMAQIFVDNKQNLPIRYAAYLWPTKPGGQPVPEEEYTYLNLKTNVGLTDADFDPYNKAYGFYK